MYRNSLFCLLLVSALSCGAETDPGPTGGKTNWLSPCDEDADCSDLEDAICARERCTTTCDGDAECANIGADTCASVEGESVCVAEGYELSPAQKLCDGSDDVRAFGFSTGGYVGGYFGFYGAYGHSFLAIDGHCQYWASVQAGGRIHIGTLSDTQAEQVERELQFGRLAEFEGLPSGSCPDGGTTVLRDPSGQAVCGCDCGALGETFQAQGRWTQDLFMEGEDYLGESMQLLIVEDETLVATDDGIPWTVDLDPLANLYEYDSTATDGGLVPADAGQTVTDADVLTQLDALREAWIGTSGYRIHGPSYVVVELEGGDAGAVHALRVYMRDVLPPKVLAEFRF